MNNSILIIFTKNPELGKVKTRLAQSVGKEKALEIYKFLLNKTKQVTRNLPCDKAVYYSEEIIENDLWSPETFSKKLQKGDNLGQRMENAFFECFSEGYKKVIIIGSDLYDITPSHIETAFKKLEAHDAVIGPAADGGYYLLGLKQLFPKVFQQKKWSTDTVLRDTLEDLKTVDVALLDTRNDIDNYNDIKAHPAFQKFLKSIKI
ncbi:TIGR04282 family arsenosugar biosynthesis glycosyltransferase [Galbibacter sp. EGI 63066]|uniref:TIGR04282 family arsenosugar biosynthesis glycosyltransferase n=1 Tax=Galbibacter sp. EGI 63066 TaxID=2993559 RepID=UPI002249540D|nr:TIGR04282 family arsenosugar biosynthesis glycosyltransferase [Galbibacter sp. EGI 63066]MCX2679931.1 TIGR04282 family arsenosugar biosynthesis glycosyltransferase [Galbibacter sp. EGI 63066]